ncbi:MAG TPA: hypothetical protein VMT76_00830 [Puia sp.]|nr:hypothetical protein [Puia sp.]
MEIKEAEIIFQGAALKLSQDKLHFHTIQFLIKKKNSKYNFNPYGSGVLVEIEDQYLIFTASHVVETADSDPLFILTRIGVTQVIGSSSNTNFKNDKNTDLAYIILDKMLGLLLTETYQFLPLTKISHSHVHKETANYMVCGYPDKNLWIKEGDIITGSSHFLLSMANEKTYEYYHFDKQKNYVLNFAGKGVDIVTGKRSEKISDPYGMSGSGLWYLQVRPEPGKMVLDYFLIGIMMLFKKSRYHVLVGNKIELIMADLQANGIFDFDWKVLSK